MLMTSTLSPRAAAAAGTASGRVPWFASRSLGDGVTVIAEPGHVNSFLVTGETHAVLFDSGMGIAPMLPEIRAVTPQPFLVVNSHEHFDHRGGNAELAPHADAIAVHPAGMGGHAAAPASFHSSYADTAARVSRDFDDFARLDDETFFTLTPEQRVRPLPDLSGWRIPAVAPTRALADGERLELGGRTLTVLHTPGHTPDSLCLYDEASGTLFSGDTVLAAAYWLHQPGADIAVLADTLDRLARLPLRRVCVAHNLLVELPASAVARSARALTAVADGRTTPSPGADIVGRRAWRHVVDGVTVLTPWEDE
jgi:glyoxylase-like metal-dependent hydrolase (beta-lactamase superfamily II)